MKKLVNNFMKSGRIFQFSMLTAVALVAMSCEKNDDIFLGGPQDMNRPERGGNPSGEFNIPVVKPTDISIAQIAIDAEFTELVNALSFVDNTLGTGLIEMFAEGNDQYTVFAPTNEAFEALYKDLGVVSIDKLPAELVRDVLFYHVVEGRRASFSVVPANNPRTITTLLNETFMVNSDSSISAIGNTANIIAADYSASNGIVHVIDAVILPIN